MKIEYEPLEKVFIKWAVGTDGSLNIRKWSQFPFPDATEYASSSVLTRERDEAREENTKLRQIVSDAADTLPNGAFISPDCSVEFMAGLPKEISLVIATLTPIVNSPLAGGTPE